MLKYPIDLLVIINNFLLCLSFIFVHINLSIKISRTLFGVILFYYVLFSLVINGSAIYLYHQYSHSPIAFVEIKNFLIYCTYFNMLNLTAEIIIFIYNKYQQKLINNFQMDINAYEDDHEHEYENNQDVNEEDYEAEDEDDEEDYEEENDEDDEEDEEDEEDYEEENDEDDEEDEEDYEEENKDEDYQEDNNDEKESEYEYEYEYENEDEDGDENENQRKIV